MNALTLLAFSLVPTMTLSEGLQAPLYDKSENGLPAPPRDGELRRRLAGDKADGILCFLGTTCNSCQNKASYWWSKSFTACGSEPKWQDGTKCSLGITCRACENDATWWSEKRSIACGKQPTPHPTQAPTTTRLTNEPSASPTLAPSVVPTSAPTLVPTTQPSITPTDAPTTQPSASPTLAPTTASPTTVPTHSPSVSPTANPTLAPTALPLNGKCYEAGSTVEERDAACSGDLVCARTGFDDRHFGGCHQKLGSDDYETGPGLFGIRHHCCSEIPDVADGSKCLTGSTRISTCFKCKNEASYWYSKRSYACGQEPSWEDGTKCLLGTSCKRCENTAAWVWRKFSYVCGSETNGSG